MSSPMGGTGPSRSFESRVNRVADARETDGVRKEVSVLPDWKREVSRKLGIPIAMLFGAIAVLAVRIAQYHINGVALLSDAPDTTMAVEAGVVILLSVIVMLMMPATSAFAKLGYLVGVAICLVTMHNAVHIVPEAFSLAFSSEWSNQITAMTQPNSVLFRGESIPLLPEIAQTQDRTKPTVLRLN
ncbi:MAG: hypothetical protein AAF718_09865 [Pseudomonadota bacterium]